MYIEQFSGSAIESSFFTWTKTFIFSPFSSQLVESDKKFPLPMLDFLLPSPANVERIRA